MPGQTFKVWYIPDQETYALSKSTRLRDARKILRASDRGSLTVGDHSFEFMGKKGTVAGREVRRVELDEHGVVGVEYSGASGVSKAWFGVGGLHALAEAKRLAWALNTLAGASVSTQEPSQGEAMEALGRLVVEAALLEHEGKTETVVSVLRDVIIEAEPTFGGGGMLEVIDILRDIVNTRFSEPSIRRGLSHPDQRIRGVTQTFLDRVAHLR